MSTNDRDTKFLGWAASTWEDAVNKLEFRIDTAEPNFKEDFLQILAQHGYDLMAHVIDHAPASVSDADDWNIPDLTR
jgi:hypothetical protein